MEKIHISQIRLGDSVLHNGEVKTVCGRTLNNCPFMGISIFGDTYNLGYKLVTRVNFNRQ